LQRFLGGARMSAHPTGPRPTARPARAAGASRDARASQAAEPPARRRDK